MTRNEIERRADQLSWRVAMPDKFFNEIVDFAVLIHNAALEQAAKIAETEGDDFSTMDHIAKQIRASKVNHDK